MSAGWGRRPRAHQGVGVRWRRAVQASWVQARLRQSSRALQGQMRRTFRGYGPWTRRGIIAAVLIAAVVIPTSATSQTTRRCTGAACSAPGSVLWTTRLSGAWLAVDGVAGTVPSQGEAYAASAGSLAVLGYATSVSAYNARTGQPAWQTNLSLPVDSEIISMRAWPTAIAVGVSVPASGGAQQRVEVILSAASGTELHSYAAGPYGGAILASPYSAVIVGANVVTDYANRGGRVIWQRRIGATAAAWAVSRHDLYVVQSASGTLDSSSVTAVSRIDLQTGGRTVIRLAGGHADGTLAAIVGGVMLFTGSGAVSAYSAETGERLWIQTPGVLDLVDHAGQTAYVAAGSDLAALDVATGAPLGRSTSVAASLYAVKDGIALGLDKDALGEAWGYSMSARKVVWTSAGLPWPHFFVDETGLGGSVSRNGIVTLLATCGATGNALPGGGGHVCLKPELTAVQY